MKIFLTILLFILIKNVLAEISIGKNDIYIKNKIVENEQNVLDNIIKSKNDIKSIVFDNCYGGDIGTAYLISKIIRQSKIDVYAKNTIGSACSIAYLGGVNRYIIKESNTKIIFHGIKSIESDEILEKKITAILKKFILSNVKLDEKILEEALNLKGASEGLVFEYFINKDASVYFCKLRYYLYTDCTYSLNINPERINLNHINYNYVH